MSGLLFKIILWTIGGVFLLVAAFNYLKWYKTAFVLNLIAAITYFFVAILYVVQSVAV